MHPIDHFIDNRPVKPASGGYLPNVEPATGRVYSPVAAGDTRDVEQAVTAAARAFPNWSRTPVAERSGLLLDIARRNEDNLDRLADQLRPAPAARRCRSDCAVEPAAVPVVVERWRQRWPPAIRLSPSRRRWGR